jgi:hypothetical protein
MLKLTYTENSFLLEVIEQSLEDWLATRLIFSLRSATTFHVEPSSASFLLARDLPDLARLHKLVDGDLVSLSLSDPEFIEVCLNGTWLTSNTEIDEGIFIASFNPSLEKLLAELWQESELGITVAGE